MKYHLSDYIRDFTEHFEAVVFKHLSIVSFLITAAVNPILFYLLPINTRELLPHIITFESCNLALLGIVFALAMGIKDGAVYKALRNQNVKIISSSYWRIFFCCIASTLTILIGICILSIQSWSVLWVRISVQTVGLISFVYSVLGTLHLLFYFTNLMIEDAKRNPKP